MAEMWFGNRNKMQWVPCPSVGMPVSRSSFSRGANYLHGGQRRVVTFNGARTYELNWSLPERDRLRPITDYAEGVWGEGPIFWSDPFNMDKNVLAPSYATPSLGGYDAITLNGAEARPNIVPTSANSYNYPFESAVYTITGAGANSPRHWIPIPPGYSAWVGVHGVAGSGGLVRCTTDAGVTSNLPILSVATDTRVGTEFTGTTGISLWLGGAGTITLSGIMVQIFKTSVTTPPKGGFISGQGHSGCSFDGEHPAMEAYSAALDKVGMSAKLVETGQWQ